MNAINLQSAKVRALLLVAVLGLVFIALVLRDDTDVNKAANVMTSIGLFITIYYLYQANNPEVKPHVVTNFRNEGIEYSRGSGSQLYENFAGKAKEQTYFIDLRHDSPDPQWLQYQLDCEFYYKGKGYVIELLNFSSQTNDTKQHSDVSDWVLVRKGTNCSMKASSYYVQSQIRNKLEQELKRDGEDKPNIVIGDLGMVALVVHLKIGKYVPHTRKGIHDQGKVTESSSFRDCALVGLCNDNCFVVPYEYIRRARLDITSNTRSSRK